MWEGQVDALTAVQERGDDSLDLGDSGRRNRWITAMPGWSTVISPMPRHSARHIVGTQLILLSE